MTSKIDANWISTAEAVELSGYSLEYVRRLARDESIKSTKSHFKLSTGEWSCIAFWMSLSMSFK